MHPIRIQDLEDEGIVLISVDRRKSLAVYGKDDLRQAIPVRFDARGNPIIDQTTEDRLIALFNEKKREPIPDSPFVRPIPVTKINIR